MIQQGSGSIVNISSIYGVVGPDFSIYEGTDMTMPAFYAFDKGGMIACQPLPRLPAGKARYKGQLHQPWRPSGPLPAARFRPRPTNHGCR